MNEVAEIFQGVTFKPELNDFVAQTTFDHELGFSVTEHPALVQAGKLAVVGFVMPGQQYGNRKMAETVRPVTRVEEMVPAVKTLDHQARGSGVRMLPTKQAWMHTLEKPDITKDEMGVFVAHIDESKILRRDGWPFGGAVAHIIRRRGLNNRQQEWGIDWAIWSANKHPKVQAAEAILYGQTLDSRRQAAKQKDPKPPVPEKLLIVRGADMLLQRLDVYKLAA